MRVWGPVADGLTRHRGMVLVSVVDVAGSAPREAGARMIVDPAGGFTGTIGGGTLEWRALAEAQRMLRDRADPDATRFALRPYALGPELGQCCGGRVTLAFERFTEADRDAMRDLAERERAGPFQTAARIAPGGFARRVLDDATPDGLQRDILVETFGEAPRTVALYGAGHVGRALVLALAALPFRVLWIDPRPDAFPAASPANTALIRPADAAATLDDVPDGALILVMTHSHALDLDIVDRALRADRFAYVGVIGSATKRARFEKRLAEVGLPRTAIDRLVCPIGAGGPKSKLPAVIAASVAVELLVAGEAAAAGEVAEPARSRRRAGRGA
jgi:xanthine dehydrogenase accessory factor